MYKLVFNRSAEKDLDKIPTAYYQIVSEHLLSLEKDPFQNGVKKLQGYENLYRLRVGIYRIIYSIEKKKLIVTVIKISHRNEAYK